MPEEPLDPVIHQVVRLRLMALLCRNRAATFVWVRDTLGLTDGNLGSHMQRLVTAGYATSSRLLSRSGFQVWLRITPAGDAAYGLYLAALRSYLDPPVTDAKTDAGRNSSESRPRDAPDASTLQVVSRRNPTAGTE